jgi:hypothetical protein
MSSLHNVIKQDAASVGPVMQQQTQQIHGRAAQAAGYWELAALEMIGKRPHPGRLVERDDMASQVRNRAGGGAKVTNESDD